MSAGQAAAGESARLALLGVVAALALGARLAVWTVNASHPDPLWLEPDSYSYLETAKDLLGLPAFEGREWKRGERTPVYPLWLALWLELGVGDRERVAPLLLVQCALTSLAAPLAFWLASARLPLVWAAALGVGTALEPSGIAYSNLILTEGPYAVALVLVAAALPGVVRGSRAALAGFALALGLVPLLRPVGLYLPWLLCGALLLWPPRRSARAVIAAVLVAVLVPSALWAARNAIVTDSFSLSSVSAWSRAIFARDVERARTGTTGSPDTESGPWQLAYGVDRGLTPLEIESARTQYFLETLTAHPGAALALWARNATLVAGLPDGLLADLLLLDPPRYGTGSVRARLEWLWQLGALGVWIALGMLLSLLGLLAIPFLALRLRHAGREKRLCFALLCGVVLYHLALGALVTGQGARYRAPVMPLLVWLAVHGVYALVQTTGQLRRRSRQSR